MSRVTKIICCIVLFIAVTCKSDIDPVNVDLMNDGTPRLQSIVFPGIPNDDVNIDQKNLLVKVKVPSLLPDDMIPEINLTENAALRGGMEFILENYSRGLGFFLGDSVMLNLVLKNPSPKFTDKVTTYFFRPLPSGPLHLFSLPDRFEHVLNNEETGYIWLGAENLYGNKLPKAIELVNKATGKKIVQTGWMVKGYRNKSEVNKLGIDLDPIQDLVPGIYDLTILNGDNERIAVQQPLIVKMGAAWIYYPLIYFGYQVTPGKNLALVGNNLFKGHVDMELVDENNSAIQLTDLVFSENGHALSIPIPRKLPEGQYILRLIQDQIKSDLCYRVNVFKSEEKPSYIGTIGDEIAPCSLTEPVNVARGVDIFFTFYTSVPGLARLRIVSVATASIYHGAVTPYSGGIPPKLVIPDQVPTGLYVASLEIVGENGEVLVTSRPYARKLLVK